MQLCPECHSDNVERSTSTGLRILVAFILVFFIPFGFLFFWLPFVFAHEFRCKHCLNQGKEEELLEIDWRERDKLLAETKIKEVKMETFINKWFAENQALYKVVKQKGFYLLVEMTVDKIRTYKITDATESTLIVEDVSTTIPALYYMNSEWKETNFGHNTFTAKELKYINESDLQQLKMHAYREGRLLENPVEIITLNQL